MSDVLVQFALALAYYAALIAVLRIAGKRLAGQVTTFDLIVLITIGVVLQRPTLREGNVNAIVFALTVFGAHWGLSIACAKHQRLRRWVRGAPRPLVEHGRVSFEALEAENLSYDELLAGLRKLGHENPKDVRLATLEETGHISAVAME